MAVGELLWLARRGGMLEARVEKLERVANGTPPPRVTENETKSWDVV